jgi:hypothetical protein
MRRLVSAVKRTTMRTGWTLGIFLAAACLLSAGQTHAGSGRPLLPAGERNLYKPPSYCPANHTCFTEAEWLQWDGKRAVALASAETSYPSGPTVSEKIKFAFSVPKRLCGGRFYTRARWRYAGDSNYTTSFLLSPACVWSGA